MEAILGQPFKVLDQGFVRVIDYLGDDTAVVQAARVSYGKGTKKTRADEQLIRYLLRHRHTTPFEMCELKLHVRVPMDCWRQWIRHRTASVNEYSTRYSEAIDAKQVADVWRMQAAMNRQGSSGLLDPAKAKELSKKEAELHALVQQTYRERVDLGVAREQARKDLPLSTYTEAYWKIDLKNLLNFLALRMESHAQLEIRQYATTIGEQIVSRWLPLTWAAFMDYWFNALTLSKAEQDILAAMHQGDAKAALARADKEGWIEKGPEGLKSTLERFEFEEKLKKMNMKAPWGGA
jgi:thymidylate synthase (FAD)